MEELDQKLQLQCQKALDYHRGGKIWLSRGGLLKGEDILGMNKDSLIFTFSNPLPKILPEAVYEVRKDTIITARRNDYPNQINNVLRFPYIFKRAMSICAKKINEEIKFVIAQALAYLTKELIDPKLEETHERKLVFAKNHFVPSPFNSPLKEKISKAVANAGIKSGVARI